jgi:hypothetical protein
VRIRLAKVAADWINHDQPAIVRLHYGLLKRRKVFFKVKATSFG